VTTLDERQTVKVKSLAKAMNVLECFSVAEPELGVTEIAQRLGIQKSTVCNILSTFEQMGYVTQNPQNGKYSLGLKMLCFSYIISSHMDLRRVFGPCIQQAARELGEVSYLGVPYGSNVLYLDVAYPDAVSNSRAITGESAPMYCTGLGKAILAFMTKEEREKILQEPLKKFTEYTISNPAVLHDNLEEVQQNGFAIDNMEHEYGIRCVAVPILGVDNRVVAAISVSGPSLRFGPNAIPDIVKKLKEVVQPFQNRL
jgi:DNA-binding IclR family transcriptional regulator